MISKNNSKETVKSWSVTFQKLPKTTQEFQVLLDVGQSKPECVAALTIIVMCVYPSDKNTSIEMFNLIKGPQTLSAIDIQFIADRMRDKEYLPLSYFSGATPDNAYTSSQPHSITVNENKTSHDQTGYIKLFIPSSGADSPRPLTLRQTKDNKWYLWEYSSLFLDIRKPTSKDPWK